ncbi:MAG: DUF1080 domain-containing protein [Gemmataceae bacterium]|nr:DUF1080 domain-containing protein [Gemmataceae bacterium]
MNTLCLMLTLFNGAAGDGKPATRWDFEDAAVGKLPPGWTATKTGKGEGSVWKVAEDKTAPKGPKVLAQTAAGPNSLYNLCVADKARFTDLDLSVSFKAFAGKKDQGGGPVWRYQDADNYYVVRMNPLEDNFRLYKFVAGKRIQLASADIAVADGKWHTIRVVHKGSRIQCYLNGKLHLDEKDDTFKEAGKIGLWTKADAQTYFDAIEIRVSAKQ